MREFWTQSNFSKLNVLFLNQHVEESPNTPINDKIVADIVNTTMTKLKSKNTARYYILQHFGYLQVFTNSQPIFIMYIKYF